MSTKNSDKVVGKAKAFYQQQRYADALRVLDAADVKDSAHVLYTRVRCLTKLGRLAEARQDCDKLQSVFKDARWKKLADKIDTLEASPQPPASGEQPAIAARPSEQSQGRKRVFPAVIVGLLILCAFGAIAAYFLFGARSQTPVAAPETTPAPEKAIERTATEATPTPPPPPAATPKSAPPRPQLRLRGPADLFSQEEAPDFGKTDSVELPDLKTNRTPPGSGKLGLSLAPPDEESGSGTNAEFPPQSVVTASLPGNNPSPMSAQAAKGPASPYPTESLPFTPAGSITELQTFKTIQRLTNPRGDEVALTNVNPGVGTWYILETNIGGQKNTLHLEASALYGNPMKRPKLDLYRDGLIVNVEGQPPRLYPLWAGDNQPAAPEIAGAAALNPAPSSSEIITPGHAFDSPLTAICDGFVYIRSQKPGSATKLEVATDLLRESRLGDWLVEYAKPYLLSGPDIGEDHRASPSPVSRGSEPYPVDARVEESQLDLYLTPTSLGIATEAADNRYYYGRWYKATDHPHVFVSVMKPTLVEKRIMDSYTDRVGAIGSHDKDRRESDALVYVIALDLSKFRFGYALGAEHPKLDWSPRAWQAKRTGNGPDGFNSKSPFCTVGAVPPYFAPWVEATFVGGFKREHAAIGTGTLSKINNGSHFGFVEQGIVFSRPLPGLATAAITRDGALDLFTWPADGSALLAQIAHARQNCISIVEGIDTNGISIPNASVNDWGAGSWSGDQNGNLVTLRSGLAIQEIKGDRFLLFACFTSATTNAMARVFQAYQCRYGMLLDMNTHNYCYGALYKRDSSGGITEAEYLHKDMRTGNGNDGSLKFVQKNDTRDFFYALRNY